MIIHAIGKHYSGSGKSLQEAFKVMKINGFKGPKKEKVSFWLSHDESSYVNIAGKVMSKTPCTFLGALWLN